jgi:hypothetical protein
MGLKREKNPNWKGGRLVGSNGYVLVKVEDGHHLAHINGYAYEHRIVAEQILGRKILPTELVHHKNEDRTDNRPENIEIVSSIWAHKVHHRHSGKVRQLPDEPNELVSCACGCGATFFKFDESGRLRKYIDGGHWRKGKKSKINEIVPCACGCGSTFLKYDEHQRPRKYINGHNVGQGRKSGWKKPDLSLFPEPENGPQTR